MSEPDHGADLLASEVSAREAEGGWVLDDVKWPIGAAVRASLAMALAQTEAAAGPRSLSWLLLEGGGVAENDVGDVVLGTVVQAQEHGARASRATRSSRRVGPTT